jgi:hypothetical protein
VVPIHRQPAIRVRQRTVFQRVRKELLKHHRQGLRCLGC